jgi:cytochrome c553
MLNYKNFPFLFILCFLFGFASSHVRTEKPIKDIIIKCELCHGTKGNSTINEDWPKLAGQNFNYLMKQMQDFHPSSKHRRKNAIMSSLIITLSEDDKIKLANYYSNLLGSIDTAQTHLLSLGQRIYRGGDSKGVPACLACHGPAGLGNPPAGFPRLSGQHARYIVTQLKKFRDGKRNNDKYQMMPIISKKLNDIEIIAVANYISGLYF